MQGRDWKEGKRPMESQTEEGNIEIDDTGAREEGEAEERGEGRGSDRGGGRSTGNTKAPLQQRVQSVRGRGTGGERGEETKKKCPDQRSTCWPNQGAVAFAPGAPPEEEWSVSHPANTRGQAQASRRCCQGQRNETETQSSIH